MLEAIQHVKRMRGGAQAHLMRCSDNQLYVVKFQNNPQHLRVLANELFGTKLAKHAGLTVPFSDVVYVSNCLIQHTPDLVIHREHGSLPCAAGLQFASRYALHPAEGWVSDFLPAELLNRLQNIEEFAGILVLDKWVGNADSRQAVFSRRCRQRTYKAEFIDQGNFFNGGSWTFPDNPLLGTYTGNLVYEKISGWPSFEPWLSRIEKIDEPLVRALAEVVPTQWYSEERKQMEKLVAKLIRRRRGVRNLIAEFRDSPRKPFPLWTADIRPKCKPEIKNRKLK